jgi:uncharacterized protein YceH (UPF0502 family)
VDLTPDEVRVLGCLVEKEATTPQSYPLTANALRLACNQSTSRDPVTDLSDHDIEVALQHLRELGLIRIVYSPSNRAPKYRHVLNEAWDLHAADLAVLSVLMLRGPQTPGELRSRTERQHRFVELAELDEVLDRLGSRQPEPFVVRLERVPGQKEARYATTLRDVEPAVAEAGVVAGDLAREPSSASATAAAPGPTASPTPDLAGEVARLSDELRRLRDEFESFRDQFG